MISSFLNKLDLIIKIKKITGYIIRLSEFKLYPIECFEFKRTVLMLFERMYSLQHLMHNA